MAVSKPQREPVTARDCVILLSGGVDSTACVDFYVRQHFDVRGMHLSYGQAAAVSEESASSAVADHFGIPLTVRRLEGARSKTDGEVIGRNAFFLFAALMELGANASMVALGIHSGTPYYDCSSRFLDTIQKLVNGQCDGRVRIGAPFIEWSKKDIWNYCNDRRVPVELTYSCERAAEPCGSCLSCRDLEALRASQKFNNPA